MPTKTQETRLSFPEWFKLRRGRAKLTQSKIADVLGITVQSVSSWEKGKSKPALNPYQTQQLCLILNITLDELVKGFNEEAEISIS